jgi:hypothetical protein
MSTTSTNPLRDLHHIHQRIASLREQRERGPRQVDARRKHLAQQVESLEKARADLKAIKVHNHERETERKSFDGRINQLQLQINTAKTNKEYTALVSERDTVVKARAALEDKILEGMIQEEEKGQVIQATEKEVHRLQRELAELERAVSDESVALDQNLQAAEAQLATAEAGLPNDARDVYRRLVERRGADSLAPVTGVTCTGCYTAITPQMQTQVMIGELVCCKSCGRILYTEEAIVAVESDS